MNRPPKKWWYDTVKKLRALPGISDPAKAAGWLWYHHLPPKRKIIELSKKDLQKELLKYYTGLGHTPACKQYEENTTGGTMKKKHKTKKTRKAKTRTLTAAQKKALKQGRKILKYLRTGRKISPAKEPLIIREGTFMKGKKKKSAKKSFTAGGFEGKKKYHKRPRARLHGELGGFDAVGLGSDIIGLIAGAIAGSALAKFIPIKNVYLKALVPIGLGAIAISIPQLSRIRIAQRAGLGALAIGGYAMTKTAFPKLPLMAGVEDAEGVARAIDGLPEEEKALLGIMPDAAPNAAPDEPRQIAQQPGEMLGDISMIDGIPGEMLGEMGETVLIGGGEESDFD